MDMLMTSEETKKFEKDMALFSFNKQQDILTYLDHLKAKGWTVENVRWWVEEQKKALAKENEKQKKTVKPLLKCPNCQTPMRLLPVNITPGTRIGDDSKSVWLCPNKECMHTEYSPKTVQEQMNTPR